MLHLRRTHCEFEVRDDSFGERYGSVGEGLTWTVSWSLTTDAPGNGAEYAPQQSDLSGHARADGEISSLKDG